MIDFSITNALCTFNLVTVNVAEPLLYNVQYIQLMLVLNKF